MKIVDGPRRKELEHSEMQGVLIATFAAMAGVLDYFVDFRNGGTFVSIGSFDADIVKLVYHIVVFWVGIYCFTMLFKHIDYTKTVDDDEGGMIISIKFEDFIGGVDEDEEGDEDEDEEEDEDDLSDEDIEAYLEERLDADEIVDDEVDIRENATLNELLLFDLITLPVVLIYSFIRAILCAGQYLTF